jgi:hypothetical protein
MWVVRDLIQFVFLSSALGLSAGSLSAQTGTMVGDHRPAITATGQVPLSFERATSGGARWTARGNGYRLAVSAADVEVGLNSEQLRIVFVGADAKGESAGQDALPGKVNYFVGRDPKAWLHDIPTYGRVRYKAVYPGIDIVWYGKQGRLEYDLDLQPGADPDKIAMRFDGAQKLALEPNGDLKVEMASGSLSLKLPEVYQEVSGGRKRVESGYELRAGNEVGFHLAAYDKTRQLVIDPTLVYATYFGSGGGGALTVTAVAVDALGSVYMGGSVNYNGLVPTVNALQPGVAGGGDAFVTKFDPTGTTILYSTYLGGSGGDSLNGIAVDASGNLVGVGETSSSDFPLVNPVTTPGFGAPSGFAFRLDAAGNSLLYSTYLVGNIGQAVALDPTGNAYITGRGFGGWTTPGALDGCCTFVEKLSNTGSEVYAASIGGQQGYAIAADAQGAAYVAGLSTDVSFFSNPPGAQPINAGGGDAFVAKLSPDATALVWATFLGGSGSESANAIALGPGGIVYFGGQTASADLPVTSGVVQGTYGGGTDAFVASLSADGTSFGFVTYLGGGGSDTLASVAAVNGGVMVTGNTSSRDFPVANALQPAFPGPPYGFLKSTDSGASFSPADNGLVESYGGTILPDPSTAGTLVMGTELGIFRTTDDGATWAMTSSGYGNPVRSLSNPSVLYVALYTVLLQSTDGGETWNSIPIFGHPSTSVGVSPTDPSTVFLFGDYVEYYSTNGGVSFQESVITPFSCVAFSSGPCQIVASPDGSMYAATGQSYAVGGPPAGSGLYKSTNAGILWTKLGSGVLPSYLPGFAVSPSNPSVLYAADGKNVYKSTNAGTSWSTIAPGAAVMYLAVDPSNAQRVYGSSSLTNEVLISTDGGVTWSATGGLLDSSGILGLAVSPFSGAEVYVSNYVPQSGFVAKLGSDGKTLTWSTYYGSASGTTVGGAAVAPSGDLWVAGTVGSESLPLTPDARNSNTHASGTAFLAEIADATATCAYSINPSTEYSYSAGRQVFSVTAPSGCAWTATPSDGWIHLIRGSGTGSGTIPLTVDSNTTANTRNGTVTVNSQIYTIVQPPSSCTYQVTNPSVTSAGGTASITVTAPAGCPWDVGLQTSDPAIVTSPSTGTGNGTVMVSVPPNAGVNNIAYGVQIGSSSSSISQASACVYSFPDGASMTVQPSAGVYGTPVVANLAGCQWTPVYGQPWITDNNPPSNAGTLHFGVTANDTGADRIAHVAVGNQQYTVTQVTAEFADVPPSATFFDAANLMFEAGVTTGCVPSSDPATRLYCPDNNVTRQEMAAFIVRAVTGTNTPAIYNPIPYFADVPPTNPFFAHIQKLVDLGITTGCSPGLYCPTATIPRWEMAIFMVRARLESHGAAFQTATTPYFGDVPTNVEGNGIPFPYIQRSYEERITNGCGSDPTLVPSLIYCPDLLVTRGQMASFIMRGLFNETTSLGPSDPQLTGVLPNTMASVLGSQITVTIIAVNKNFQPGDAVTVPSSMLTVSNVVVNSPTSISATLTTNATTSDGPQSLVVTTGGRNLTLPLAIKVGTY